MLLIHLLCVCGGGVVLFWVFLVAFSLKFVFKIARRKIAIEKTYAFLCAFEYKN